MQLKDIMQEAVRMKSQNEKNEQYIHFSEKRFYMKKSLLLVFSAMSLVGCSANSLNVEQSVKELQAGQNYDINTLVSVEEGVSVEVINDEIIIDELGTYSVEFKFTKDGEEEFQTFKYKVIDTIAPTISKTKDFNIIQGETFKLSDYVIIEDNVKDDLINKATHSEIDTSKLGEQNFTITVADSSGNTTKESYTLTVVEPKVSIKPGETVVSKWGTKEVEYSLYSVGFQEEVYSYSDNMFASYYSDAQGEQYLVVKANIKNLCGETISDSVIDEISVIFDDKYTYALQQLDTTSSVMSRFWAIEPLKSQEVFFLNTIPDELVNSHYKIYFKIGTTEYVIEK